MTNINFPLEILGQEKPFAYGKIKTKFIIVSPKKLSTLPIIILFSAFAFFVEPKISDSIQY